VGELPDESTERLARVTKLLATQRSLPARLETVVAIAKRTIPNCHAAGISLLIDGTPTTGAASDRLAVEIDLVQYRTGEGPCLSAIEDSNVVRIDVLERDSRFQRFGPGALARDIDRPVHAARRQRSRGRRPQPVFAPPERLRRRGGADGQTPGRLRREVISTSPLYA